MLSIQVKAIFADETLDFAITSRDSNSISRDVYDYDYTGSGDGGGREGATLDIHAGIEVDAENRELAFDVEMSPGVRFFFPFLDLSFLASDVVIQTLFDINPRSHFPTEAK